LTLHGERGEKFSHLAERAFLNGRTEHLGPLKLAWQYATLYILLLLAPDSFFNGAVGDGQKENAPERLCMLEIQRKVAEQIVKEAGRLYLVGESGLKRCSAFIHVKNLPSGLVEPQDHATQMLEGRDDILSTDKCRNL